MQNALQNFYFKQEFLYSKDFDVEQNTEWGTIVLVETSKRGLIEMLMRGYDVSRVSRGHRATLGNNDRDIFRNEKMQDNS